MINWDEFSKGLDEIFDDAPDKNKTSKQINIRLPVDKTVNLLIFQEKEQSRILQVICDYLIITRNYYNEWITILEKPVTFVNKAMWQILKKRPTEKKRNF